MLGRDVVLQIPVSPMSVNLGVTRGEVEGGNLIHVLAAKALIQAFEDLPSTPESKAQIERLGKRYSLASSATSFVAIDGDEEYETTPLQPQEEELVPDVYGLAAVVAYPDEDEDGCEDGEANVGYFMQAMQEESDEDMGFGLWDGEDAPVAPGGAAAFAAAPVLAVSAFTSDSFSPTSPGYGPQSFGYSSAMPQNFHSASPGYSPSSPQYSPTTTFTQSSSIVDAAPSVPKPAVISNAAEIKLPPPPPPPLRTLTVDSIARAQRFDGSFPYDLNHFIFIFEGREALATSALQLPPLLSSTSANEADKMTIWVTIVTLACLQQKFASEKDAWELLAEKAQELVVGLLADLGLSESKTQEVVAKLADDAIPLF
ncbi:von Willebrand factor A domain-containing protein 5A [Serendipita sp. 399]|nr:von Willebrand factor A domain-containing protein 5A [Serendipita sp. 399]